MASSGCVNTAVVMGSLLLLLLSPPGYGQEIQGFQEEQNDCELLGGWCKVDPPDEQTVQLLETIRPQVEQEYGYIFTEFIVESYSEQVVSGMNYNAKVRISNHQCLLITVFWQSWTGILTFSEVNNVACDDSLPLEEDRFDIGDFNIELFRELATNTNSSIFISPYSIWSAFLLTYFGSEGTSKEQLEAALGVRGKSSVYTKWKMLEFLLEKPGQQNGAIFRSLNKAYFDTSITIKNSILEFIQPNIEEVNFVNKIATADLINEEVNRTTDGIIPKLIKPEELSQTLLLLLNAVYFKGKWEDKFESKDTEIREFYDEQNNKKVLGQVEMMRGKQYKAQLGRNTPLGDADIVAIPYHNSSISMIFIKPTSIGTTLDSILSKLSYDILQGVLRKMVHIPVFLTIPKFRMETEMKGDLVKAMNSLGVSDIFSDRANLTGFSNTHLKVDKVIHKAVIEVTEQGTTAAAATAVQIVPLSFIPTPDIYMDRPFIYLIHDKSANVTLFAGTFRHPDHVQSLG